MRRLNENKDRTLSILSHDLRGPIANLHAISELALKRKLSQDEFLNIVQSVNEKTFQTLEFLDTTLNWTKSNFDAIHVTLEDVDISHVVNTIFTLYEVPIRAKNLKVGHALSNETIRTDPDVFTIVVRNVISNAIKFTPKGGSIVISHQNTRDGQIIMVDDTGIGMSAEMIKEIFSDHYQSRRGTQQEKGLGIGLKSAANF